MIIYIDIDGVICTNTYGKYVKAVPIKSNIKKVNKLYAEGNEIVLWTARGTLLKEKKEEIQKITKEQLKRWKVKYTSLKFGKPYYDVIIDDRSVSMEDIYGPNEK
jgi:histidinol phosphatase-like enzyme